MGMGCREGGGGGRGKRVKVEEGKKMLTEVRASSGDMGDNQGGGSTGMFKRGGK